MMVDRIALDSMRYCDVHKRVCAIHNFDVFVG